MKKVLLLVVVVLLFVPLVLVAFDTVPMQVSVIKDDLVTTAASTVGVLLMAIVSTLLGFLTKFLKDKWGISVSNDMTDMVERYATIGITAAEKMAVNAGDKAKDKIDSDAKMKFAMKIGWALLKRSNVKKVTEEELKQSIESLLHRGILEQIEKRKA